MSQPANKPSIRQAHADRTRTAILEAAVRVFSTCGYADAGVREIAAEAGASPALIGRYFGSKLELFEAALEACLDVSVFTGAARAEFGEVIAELFLDDVEDVANPVPMLVFSGGDPLARQAALRILKQRVVEPLKLWFGEPQAAERVAQLLAVATGIFTYRLLLPLEPVAHPTPDMRKWLAQTLQALVDA